MTTPNNKGINAKCWLIKLTNKVIPLHVFSKWIASVELAQTLSMQNFLMQELHNGHYISQINTTDDTALKVTCKDNEYVWFMWCIYSICQRWWCYSDMNVNPAFYVILCYLHQFNVIGINTFVDSAITIITRTKHLIGAVFC